MTHAAPVQQPGQPASRIRLAEIETLAQFAAAAQEARHGRSFRDLNKGRPAGQQLATSTIGDLVNGNSVPTDETLVAYLNLCEITGPAQQPWLEALDRVKNAHLRRPPGAVRAREASLRRLGVHPCIKTESTTDDLPPYVPRDVDGHVRRALLEAAYGGGLVLLMGSSCSGKTRALAALVQMTLPDWWVLQPADAAAVREFAQDPAPRTVLWLDEIQSYLDQPGGLPVSIVRGLLSAGTVVAGTLWPEQYAARTAPRPHSGLDPHAEARAVLALAEVIDVAAAFSADERARAASTDDERIQTALNAGEGVTQVLAAGPELIRRWSNAPSADCYGQAVMTAALDARRVGAQTPVTAGFLADAAPAYLNDRQQAAAPEHWLVQGLAYATQPVLGAAACLNPVAAGMGRTVGFTAADYLYQHVLRVSRVVAVPDQVWQALINHHDPGDRMRLAENAENRGRPDHAETLYRQIAADGDHYAIDYLIDMFEDAGRINEAVTDLTRWADAGNPHAVERLAWMLHDGGQVDALRLRALAGDQFAAERLAALHQIEVLRECAANGNRFARIQLLLAETPDPDTLIAVLIDEIDDPYAALHLREAWVRFGRIDDVKRLADDGDQDAAAALPRLLAAAGRLDDALALLEGDDQPAALERARLLALHHRFEDLLQMANNGDPAAEYALTSTMSDSSIEELRQRATDGSEAAARLNVLLALRGDVEELRRRSDGGDRHAVLELARLLGRSGNPEGAVTMIRTTFGPDFSGLEGAVLVHLLEQLGRYDELQQEIHAGTYGAAAYLEDVRDHT